MFFKKLFGVPFVEVDAERTVEGQILAQFVKDRCKVATTLRPLSTQQRDKYGAKFRHFEKYG